MPKATIEGGASNAADPGIVVCADCGTRYAAGAPRCPECPSTQTMAADVPADGAEPDAAAPGEDGQEPPEETPDPSAGPEGEPAPAPRTPPRRPPQPKG